MLTFDFEILGIYIGFHGFAQSEAAASLGMHHHQLQSETILTFNQSFLCQALHLSQMSLVTVLVWSRDVPREGSEEFPEERQNSTQDQPYS